MSYFVLSDLEALIPPGWVVEALDDDADGDSDALLFDAVRRAAEAEVNGKIGRRYAVPLTPAAGSSLAQWLQHAASMLAAGLCYKRRGADAWQKCPYQDEIKDIRTDLGKIASGELPLDVGEERAVESAEIISDDSRVNSTGVLY
jgi:phage gp36-like protein